MPVVLVDLVRPDASRLGRCRWDENPADANRPRVDGAGYPLAHKATAWSTKGFATEVVGYGSVGVPTTTTAVVLHGLVRVCEARDGRRENR